MYMNGTGMFLMAWMALLTLGLIAAVVGVIVWLARSDVFTNRPAGPALNRTEAEAILRNRYAAGEIDAEEYQRRLAVLHGQTPRAGMNSPDTGPPDARLPCGSRRPGIPIDANRIPECPRKTLA